MNIKNKFAFIITLTLIFSSVSCGKKTTPDDRGTTENNSADSSYTAQDPENGEYSYNDAEDGSDNSGDVNGNKKTEDNNESKNGGNSINSDKSPESNQQSSDKNQNANSKTETETETTKAVTFEIIEEDVLTNDPDSPSVTEAQDEDQVGDENDGDDEEGSEGENSGETPNGEFTGGDMSFEVNGTSYNLLCDAGPILDALGEPDFVNELSNHLENGADAKIYTFGFTTVSTYTDNGREILYEICFEDDSFSTSKGMYINMPEENIADIYGGGEKTGNIIYFYAPDNENAYMYAVITSEIVTSIGYCFNL